MFKSWWLALNSLCMSVQPFWLEVPFTLLLNTRDITGAVLRTKLANMENLESISSACISTEIISL